jgi:hypothetical protein
MVTRQPPLHPAFGVLAVITKSGTFRTRKPVFRIPGSRCPLQFPARSRCIPGSQCALRVVRIHVRIRTWIFGLWQAPAMQNVSGREALRTLRVRGRRAATNMSRIRTRIRGSPRPLWDAESYMDSQIGVHRRQPAVRVGGAAARKLTGQRLRGGWRSGWFRSVGTLGRRRLGRRARDE